MLVGARVRLSARLAVLLELLLGMILLDHLHVVVLFLPDLHFLLDAHVPSLLRIWKEAIDAPHDGHGYGHHIHRVDLANNELEWCDADHDEDGGAQRARKRRVRVGEVAQPLVPEVSALDDVGWRRLGRRRGEHTGVGRLLLAVHLLALPAHLLKLQAHRLEALLVAFRRNLRLFEVLYRTIVLPGLRMRLANAEEGLGFVRA
mmetsp:Transcript_9232/g.18814  ORF Transcript_9232/g.18814 Transcript_9232/m.18814 type:complete len:203 (+) Transcript_9232:341-949(+)